MKKLIAIFIILSAFVSVSFAETFTDAIQDLAVRTACVGQYSMTEAGGGWYEDPNDYYTPQMIASRLAQESGSMTSIGLEPKPSPPVCLPTTVAHSVCLQKRTNFSDDE